ncbi:hypothetical protein T10_8328, partial [Trichinella papuae]
LSSRHWSRLVSTPILKRNWKNSVPLSKIIFTKSTIH